MSAAAEGVPRHIGFILDGNRRWAKDQGLPSFEGHRQGYENLITISLEAFKAGCTYVSAYIFSTENWKRSQDEVGYLMDLVIKLATKDIDRLLQHDIKVVFLGSREGLSDKVRHAIDAAEEKSKHKQAGTMVLCFNYGGRQELIDAADQLRKSTDKSDQIGRYIYHPEIPDVDFLIRTSGEQRLSNFMLWRIAYAELYFVPQHWPAFTVDDLYAALQEFARRQRRFGK